MASRGITDKGGRIVREGDLISTKRGSTTLRTKFERSSAQWWTFSTAWLGSMARDFSSSSLAP
jgi:hypothetical protein